MSTKSYSNLNSYRNSSKGPFAAEIDRLGRVLDKYTKFYWRGEDMWETYNTFITNNGSALKFINGPSFSNTYSSPQYDHAVGNLTGVKFSRMQVSFSICTYAVTAEEYRKLIMALGPYEIDYLSFEYDKKMCYLVKTTNLKEGTKTVIGVDKNGNDLYLVENTLTFEVQGEQCAIAQRQYMWKPDGEPTEPEQEEPKMWYLEAVSSPDDVLDTSEIPYGIVNEINFIPSGEKNSFIKLEIAESQSGDWHDAEEFSTLYEVVFNEVNYEWRNTQNDSTVDINDKSFSIKYDSASGLIYFMYAQEDYKTLNLLTTNEYGDYLIKDLKTVKVKIDKNTSYSKIIFRITYSKDINIASTVIYGRAKTVLI